MDKLNELVQLGWKVSAILRTETGYYTSAELDEVTVAVWSPGTLTDLVDELYIQCIRVTNG